MKKLLILSVLAAIAICFVSSCGTPGLKGTAFSAAIGKNLKLVEVRIEHAFPREVLFNRAMLSKENAGSAFLLKIEASSLSGTASPNSYSAPYTLGERQAITISPMRSTKMATLLQPEKLREERYYEYMQNAYEWEISNGRLLIHSKTEDGRDIRLMFSL